MWDSFPRNRGSQQIVQVMIADLGSGTYIYI